MPINWNGVNFHETPVVEGGPDFSFLPAQESRYQMRGWFDWSDVVTQAATKAYAGWCQVATGYVPLDGDGNRIGNLPNAPAAVSYFNYTNPFPHPDWPNQMYLCEGLGNVRGSVPGSPAIGPNRTAVFDEAHTTLHFRSPKNGYRTLGDYQVLDLITPRAGGNNFFIPREYFCTRNMEVVEQTTVRSQTIPADAGLQWRTLQANGQAGGPGNNVSVSSTNWITTYEGELSISWYPVPLFGFNEPGASALIGACNQADFPPAQPVIPGVPTVPSMLTRRAGQKTLNVNVNGQQVQRTFFATLVWGQFHKDIIRQGDTFWAYKIDLKLKWYPYGANSFFWWNPPAGTRGRVNIDPANGPFADATLGGPGYYPVQRPDGTQLFQPGDFTQPFVPRGMTF